MAEEAKNQNTSNLGNLGGELDAALTTLESVLGEASQAVAGIRATLPQIAALGEVVAELETAMTSAYQHLRVPFGQTETQPAPAILRAVPPSEPEPIEGETTQPENESAQPEAATTSPEASPLAEVEPAPEAWIATPETAPIAEPEPAPEASIATPEAAPLAEPEPAPESSIATPEASPLAEPEPAPESPIQLPQSEEEPAATATEAISGSAASDSLQLSVSATSGSLDLKAVDRSINENPAVVDVTLLDYDGRNATLKVWITETADPVGVREALLESFRRNLGEGQNAEVSIDLEAESA